MARDEERSEATENEEKSVSEQSPSEKLEGRAPLGTLVPGAENPESDEIKDEVNPNTE